MRAGLLLISLGLVGLFAHSIGAKAIKTRDQDEAKSNGEDDIDWSKKTAAIAIDYARNPNLQVEDGQSGKLRRALDSTTPDPYESIDWSKHDLQDEAESWERSGSKLL